MDVKDTYSKEVKDKETSDQKFQNYWKKFICPEITDQDIWDIIKEDVESKKLIRMESIKEVYEKSEKRKANWGCET